jgi:protein tyrosine phosphatase (PTP) superfamily phosphohydrolase (DUF442 family)
MDPVTGPDAPQSPSPTAPVPGPAPEAGRTTRRRVLRRLLLVGAVGLAGEQTWRHGRDYVFADKFAVVEPGKVYRGAWQKDLPMRRIIRDRQIRTIVALAHPPDSPLVAQEKDLSAELGVKWLHIPIVDTRQPGDPSVSDRLEAAAAAIADPANQPVYFHCHHGVNRASMAQMAYRMMYCGWDLQQAQDEIARTFGLREVSKGPDYRHMASFYAERVLPRRQSPPSLPAPPAATAAAGAGANRR